MTTMYDIKKLPSTGKPRYVVLSSYDLGSYPGASSRPLLAGVGKAAQAYGESCLLILRGEPKARPGQYVNPTKLLHKHLNKAPSS